MRARAMASSFADALDLGAPPPASSAACPDPPGSGLLLDLGCGWGPIALALADAAPGATVLAVDVNERTVDLAARNAAAAGHTNIHAAEATTLATELRGSNTYVDLEGYSVGGGAGHGVAGRFMAALSCLDHSNAVGPSGLDRLEDYSEGVSLIGESSGRAPAPRAPRAPPAPRAPRGRRPLHAIMPIPIPGPPPPDEKDPMTTGVDP